MSGADEALFLSLSLTSLPVGPLTNEGKLKEEGEQTARADAVRISSDHVDSTRRDYAEQLRHSHERETP